MKMKAKKLLMSIFFTAVSICGLAQDRSLFFDEAEAFFGEYIKTGKVDYKGIRSNPDKLDHLLDLANNIVVTKDDSKTYQAFWINFYNLSVIKGVVDNYPIGSPLDVSGFFDKKTYLVGGKHWTLNEIENKLLRSNFPNEARFHFALVCAGLGCPPIINQAYLPETLEHQLQRQTELSLNNPQFVRIKEGQVALSQIFEWYKSDFTQNGKNFVEFINLYRKEKLDPKIEVVFYPYDWSLNKLD